MMLAGVHEIRLIRASLGGLCGGVLFSQGEDPLAGSDCLVRWRGVCVCECLPWPGWSREKECAGFESLGCACVCVLRGPALSGGDEAGGFVNESESRLATGYRTHRARIALLEKRGARRTVSAASQTGRRFGGLGHRALVAQA